jgi:hypothetical protein
MHAQDTFPAAQRDSERFGDSFLFESAEKFKLDYLTFARVEFRE